MLSFVRILSTLVIATCSLFLQSVECFRPPAVRQELGCSPTLSLFFGSTKEPNFFFDPLKIANDGNFAQLRESELKHGRVAMLAVLETILVPFLRHSAFLKDQDLTGGILPSLLKHNIPDYATVLITCAFLETVVFIQRDPKSMPGDYGTGYFGVRDKGLNEYSLVSELENGRLAMIALSIEIFNEVVTGESWDEQWLGFFKQWVRQFL